MSKKINKCNHLKFKHPFTCLVGGMTSSGKTYLVRQILSEWKYLIHYHGNKLNVLWCYGQMQKLYNKKLKNVETTYFEGIPNLSDIRKIAPSIIVIDDLMDEMKNDEVKRLFTKGSHHMNISVIFIVQNLFNNNMRTIGLNTHYILVMKGLRLAQQVGFLARQIAPHKMKEIMKIFKSATSKPFGYLLFDLHPHSSDKYRLRTRILRKEIPSRLAKLIVVLQLFTIST